MWVFILIVGIMILILGTIIYSTAHSVLESGDVFFIFVGAFLVLFIGAAFILRAVTPTLDQLFPPIVSATDG